MPKSSPFFFLGLEKKHTTTERSPFRAANKTRAAAALEATLCTQAELGDKMDRETKPTEGGGGWNGVGWRLPPF